MEDILKMRKTGSLQLVKREQKLVASGIEQNIEDSKDLWRYYGNDNPDDIPEMELDVFLQTVKLIAPLPAPAFQPEQQSIIKEVNSVPEK